MRRYIWLFALGGVGCGQTPAPTIETPAPDLTADVAAGQAYGTPPQCYARTQTSDGAVHNGCYTCHADSKAPNYLGSPEFQVAYSFPEAAQTNRWTNLFVDRSDAMRAIDDEAALVWARTDNYHDGDGIVGLSSLAGHVPAQWDVDGNGAWDGFIPDASLNFDAAGFDRDPAGRPTGWRTYAWHPRPGLFLPTNGSMTDALIRLPRPFREDAAGVESSAIYALNLAILEAAIKRSTVAIPPTDEAAIGIDLDRDGTVDVATQVVWDWAPREGRTLSWVGRAASDPQIRPPTAGLFPVGTEFFHTLRYFDVVDGAVKMGRRMKEVRYLRKRTWKTYGQLEDFAQYEAKEDFAYPDRLPPVVGDLEGGVRLNNGWVLAGFIEDGQGELRPQTKSELAFCTGCHSGASSTDDGVFSFGRKLDGSKAAAGGWYHWQDRPMVMGDYVRPDGAGAYATYLRTARAADPFRANAEALAAFFTPDGAPREDRIDALARDATPLLLPSPERALLLNKTYQAIVAEQSYDRGRDPLPALTGEQAWRQLEPDQPTGIVEPATLGF